VYVPKGSDFHMSWYFVNVCPCQLTLNLVFGFRTQGTGVIMYTELNYPHPV